MEKKKIPLNGFTPFLLIIGKELTPIQGHSGEMYFTLKLWKYNSNVVLTDLFISVVKCIVNGGCLKMLADFFTPSVL